MNTIINRTELLEKNSFSDMMRMCYPSWAAFIYTTDGKKYKLHYNYRDDNRSIASFGSIMGDFCYLLDLKEGEFGDELKDIEDFYNTESERCGKEFKEKINLKK